MFNHRLAYAQQTAFGQPEAVLRMLLYSYLEREPSITSDVLINLQRTAVIIRQLTARRGDNADLLSFSRSVGFVEPFNTALLNEILSASRLNNIIHFYFSLNIFISRDVSSKTVVVVVVAVEYNNNNNNNNNNNARP